MNKYKIVKRQNNKTKGEQHVSFDDFQRVLYMINIILISHFWKRFIIYLNIIQYFNNSLMY